MNAVHEANLIHRELKPENILIVEKGHVRLSDFDVSYIVENQRDSKTRGIGTIAFMSPEFLNMKTHYNKVNIYSFGVVLFFVLSCGKMPK